jgi:hypothetical protein
MSKSAIVSRAPDEFRGTSPLASRTVRWMAPQNPMGSGFSVGVTVTVHGVCARAPIANSSAATVVIRTINVTPINCGRLLKG